MTTRDYCLLRPGLSILFLGSVRAVRAVNNLQDLLGYGNALERLRTPPVRSLHRWLASSSCLTCLRLSDILCLRQCLRGSAGTCLTAARDLATFAKDRFVRLCGSGRTDVLRQRSVQHFQCWRLSPHSMNGKPVSRQIQMDQNGAQSSRIAQRSQLANRSVTTTHKVRAHGEKACLCQPADARLPPDLEYYLQTSRLQLNSEPSTSAN